MRPHTASHPFLELFRSRRLQLPAEPPEAIRIRAVPRVQELTVLFPNGDTFLVTPQELDAQLRRWGFNEEESGRAVDYVTTFFGEHLDIRTKHFVWIPPEEIPSDVCFPIA